MIHWEVPPSRRLAFVAVLLVMATSVVATPVLGFRVGGYLLAASLALAALLRGLLPAKYCLGLLVRTRRTDVVLACVLAVSIAFLAATVPG
jgi:hypothetical protein